MTTKKIAIVTSKESWFVPVAKKFVTSLQKKKYRATLFFTYNEVPADVEIVFILSYFKLIPAVELKKHPLNLVVHESNLPAGKGWSPLFWQILEGKHKIPVVLFEAVAKMDAGKIYLKQYIELDGTELHGQIRRKQAAATIRLCYSFLQNAETIKPRLQSGEETVYPKRSPQDSVLDIQKSIRSQFNLLRIAHNKQFPAFFIYKGHKYLVKISKDTTYEHSDRS